LAESGIAKPIDFDSSLTAAALVRVEGIAMLGER
jgi:hypothetical protein